LVEDYVILTIIINVTYFNTTNISDVSEASTIQVVTLR